MDVAFESTTLSPNVLMHLLLASIWASGAPTTLQAAVDESANPAEMTVTEGGMTVTGTMIDTTVATIETEIIEEEIGK